MQTKRTSIWQLGANTTLKKLNKYWQAFAKITLQKLHQIETQHVCLYLFELIDNKWFVTHSFSQIKYNFSMGIIKYICYRKLICTFDDFAYNMTCLHLLKS